MQKLRTLGLVLVALGIIEWSWAVFCVFGGALLGLAGFAEKRTSTLLWVGGGAYLLLAVAATVLGIVHVAAGVRARSGRGLYLLIASAGACLVSMVLALYCFPFSLGALIYTIVVLADADVRRTLDGGSPA